jgi:hypothetical protein
MMMIGMFSFVNQFFGIVNNCKRKWWWSTCFLLQINFLEQCKGKLIDGSAFLQINHLSEGYNVRHLDQCYVPAWLCRNIIRCKCIVMFVPSQLCYVKTCIIIVVLIWANYPRIKSRFVWLFAKDYSALSTTPDTACTQLQGDQLSIRLQ